MSNITVKPIATALGAEIEGVDLAQDLSDATVREIRQALLDYCVIFFRDQDFNVDEHKRLARKFGGIFVHPNFNTGDHDPEVVTIVRKPGDTRIVGEDWHTDTTMMAEPPMGAILYALTKPELGETARLVGVLLLGVAAFNWVAAFFGWYGMLQKARISFLLLALVPGGNPAVRILGDQATPESIAELEAELGLDDPIVVRYLRWLGDVLQGDLGRSTDLNQDVSDVLADKLPVTIQLAFMALTLNTHLLLLLIGGIYVMEAGSVAIQMGVFKASGRTRRLFRMSPIHHHFELGGWPETTVIIRFWLISALCVATALAIFIADYTNQVG